MHGRSAGFTLIEMAVVIFIMAIILGSIVVPLSNQVEQRQFQEAQRQLEDAREALVGYALAQARPYLPCPDKTAVAGVGTANDGIEDVNADGTCVSDEGNLPWATLGMPALDTWGHRLRYRVSPEYALHAAPYITLNSNGTLQMCAAVALLTACDAGQAITESTVPLNKPAAVLLSHGPNGWGAIDPVTNAQILPPGCANAAACGAQMSQNEIANADETTLFVSRAPSSTNSGSGQFDDIVVWLSPHSLKQRLVAGGRLP